MIFNPINTEIDYDAGESSDNVFVFPASFSQQRLWFMDRLASRSALYSINRVLKITGSLNVAVLWKSIDEIIRRHEALRTVFSMEDGSPVQVIMPDRVVDKPVVDMSHIKRDERDSVLQKLINEAAKEPFGLEKWPLLRLKLIHFTDDDHVLMITFHHIISDGWSIRIFDRELSLLYNAFCKGQPLPLPELPLQYADFSVWQREQMQGDFFEKQSAYWRRQLENVPILDLPTDYPRPSIQTFKGKRHYFEVTGHIATALKELSRRTGCSLFMTLLAAFQILLYRYSGQDDIVTGSPVSGRHHVETEGLIGFFVNTIVLRTDLSDNPVFTELMKRVRETVLDAFNHQDIPFEKLVEEIKYTRSTSYSPIIQVMFTLNSAGPAALKLDGLKVTAIPVDSGTSKFDLTLSLKEASEGVTGYFEYNTDLFSQTTIKQMASCFHELLGSIAGNPDRPILELALFTEKERDRIVFTWNDTQSDYPREKSIHRLFEIQAEISPDAVAVLYREHRLTYGELNRRANHLAGILVKKGVKPNLAVGICAEPSLELIIGMVAVLKAGGAYVPLDTSYPDERLAFMLEDTRISVILTQKSLASRILPYNRQVVHLDTIWEETDAPCDLPPCSAHLHGDALAYVNYTSGSTGRPKGVCIPHKGVVRLVLNTNYIAIKPSDRIAQISNISFDAVTFEVWGALLNGASLYIIDKEILLSPQRFIMELRANGITTMFITTALFNHYALSDPTAFNSITHLLFGGEAANAAAVRNILANGGPKRLLHVYGPTESTTFTTWHPVTSLDKRAKTVPIGRPISNTQVYILDKDMKPCPVGIIGELYIGGDGLAQGYLNRPELTARRFVPDPFSGDPKARLYKTGDLGRYLEDGSIEFFGRIDHQVKLRGFRIELKEIERVLRDHPSVYDDIVILTEAASKEKRIVAYVVPEPGTTLLDGMCLRDFLRGKLPEYMVPSAFITIDAIPLTPNGKINPRGLPPPETASSRSLHKPAPPTDAIEQKLVTIWEKVIGVQPIGIKDDFFDLGGHSLLAVKLISEIKKSIGTEVSIAELFEKPTIELLAGSLKSAETLPPLSLLIPHHTQGATPPFFCIHGASAPLAHHLGTDQPFYGSMPHGLNGKPMPRRIEEMAQDYLQEIRCLQPNGPYYLGGYSLGGVVAFEMAHQLKNEGEAVNLLILIDPTTPDIFKKSRKKRGAIPFRSIFSVNGNSLKSYVNHIRNHLKDIDSRERLRYILARIWGQLMIRTGIERKVKMIICKAILARGRELPGFLRRCYFDVGARRALQQYQPIYYPGDVVIFCASGKTAERKAYWSLLVGGKLDCHEIPVEHLQMLHEPYAKKQAEIIKGYLASNHECRYS